MMLIVGSQTGRLEKRFGSKPPLLAGGAFAAASFVMLAFARDDAGRSTSAAASSVPASASRSRAMANLIIENVGPEQTGVATGMNTVARTVGGAFGGAATASILAGTVAANGYPTAHGYTAAFAACAIAIVIGILIGFAIPQRRRRAGVRTARGRRPPHGGRRRRELAVPAARELEHGLQPRGVSHHLADHHHGRRGQGRARPRRSLPASRSCALASGRERREMTAAGSSTGRPARIRLSAIVSSRAEAHEDHKRSRRPRQPLIVELTSVGRGACEHGELRGDAACGQRDAGQPGIAVNVERPGTTSYSTPAAASASTSSEPRP